MSISIPEGTVRKAVILVAAPLVLALLLLLAGCATDDVDRLSAMPMKERLEIAERIICPNGVNDWTEEGPSCD